MISFEEVGSEVDVDSVIELPIVEPYYDGEKLNGTIDVQSIREALPVLIILVSERTGGLQSAKRRESMFTWIFDVTVQRKNV